MRQRLTSLFLAAAVALPGLRVHAASVNPADSMWKDPDFIKSFTGSYGFLTGAEPKVSDKEIELLREVFDLIKVQPALAIQHLHKNAGTDASAAFDFVLGNLQFQAGALPEARRAYETAIKKFPNFRRAYKNLGLVLVQAGDFDAAIPVISKALELGEIDGRAYGLLGYGYFKAGRYYPAEAAYRQAILMQPDVRDWKVGLASCLLETARHGDAIALFDTLIAETPGQADYWLLQANALIGAQQPGRAAQNIEFVRCLGQADTATLNLLGDIYMNLQAPDLALDAYLAAADLAGDKDLHSAIRAAELLTRAGNNDEAIAMLAKINQRFAGKLDRGQQLKLLTIEAKNARASGDQKRALELLEQIVERDTLNGEALIELANHYAGEGDLARATVRFEQAAKIADTERPALVAHAQTLVRAGDYPKALPLLRRALQLRSDPHLETYTARVERAARR